MSDEDPKIIQPSDEDVAPFGGRQEPGASASAAGDEASCETGGASPESALQAEVAELTDKLLRARADYQNLRARSMREREEAVRHAGAEFARALLAVLDDFERAFEAATSAETVESVVEGVRIVYDHFQKILADRGVEVIDADGQPFDPHRHEALLQSPSAEHEAGTVIQVHQKGYLLGDRVLRPARVVVSSGPAEPLSRDDEATDETAKDQEGV